MAKITFWILLAGLGGSEIQDALAQRFPTDITATSVSTSSAASTITTTQDSSTTSSSIAGVSYSSASLASGTDSISSTSTTSTSLSSTATEASNTAASNTAANSTLMEDVKNNGSGLSSSAKVGVGIGVGVGIPLLAAILTAVFLIRRRRKRSIGLYGPVTTSDKGVGESSSFHSPSITPHELRNVGSKAPFLPPIPAQETSLPSPDQELSPMAARNEHPSPLTPIRNDPSSIQRPASSQDISRSSTLNLHTRPATAPQQNSTTNEDLPPSPVSPVSPVSPLSAASSRPSSLRRSSNYGR